MIGVAQVPSHFYKSVLLFLFLMETDSNCRLGGKHWLLSKFALRKNKSTFEIEPTDSQIIGFLYPECFSEHNCERKDAKLYFNMSPKVGKIEVYSIAAEVWSGKQITHVVWKAALGLQQDAFLAETLVLRYVRPLLGFPQLAAGFFFPFLFYCFHLPVTLHVQK